MQLNLVRFVFDIFVLVLSIQNVYIFLSHKLHIFNCNNTQSVYMFSVSVFVVSAIFDCIR